MPDFLKVLTLLQETESRPLRLISKPNHPILNSMRSPILLLFLAVAIMLSDLAQAHQEFSRSWFALKFYSETPGYDIQFKSLETGKLTKFSPNLAQRWGLRLTIHDFITLGYGFKIKQLDKELNEKGETKYEDWRFNFAFKNFVLSAAYNQYDGVYVANTSEVDPSWTAGQPFLQNPNMKIISGSVNLTYIWSPEDFSLIAALDQVVRQTKSGGSLLLGLAASQTTFKDSSPIIPSVVRSQYGSDQNIEYGSFLALSAKFGYGYTWVWGKAWYASLAAQVGGGQQRRVYRDATQERSSWHVASKLDALLSLGYNGDVIFVGGMLSGDSTSYRTTSIEISSGLYAIQLFLGGRF